MLISSFSSYFLSWFLNWNDFISFIVLFLQVLNETFPNYTFLMNGLIVGIKVSWIFSNEINLINSIWDFFIKSFWNNEMVNLNENNSLYKIMCFLQGILSFLSAPLIGALSDVWGRKFFLLITVFFTCLPIPFMKINTW